MDLISMVLGILSSGSGCTDLRLTLDLNRVFMRVDFPRPLCPDQENTHAQTHTHAHTHTDTHTQQLEKLGSHSLVVFNSRQSQGQTHWRQEPHSTKSQKFLLGFSSPKRLRKNMHMTCACVCVNRPWQQQDSCRVRQASCRGQEERCII